MVREGLGRLGRRRHIPPEKRLSEDGSLTDEASQRAGNAEVPETVSIVSEIPKASTVSDLPYFDDCGCGNYEETHSCHSCCVDSGFYLDCMFAENSTGVGDDLLLCLKRKGVKSWGLFQDYPEAMELLRSQEAKLLASNGTDQQRSKLRVEAIFAEEDSLIGCRGMLWFHKLWMGQEGWADYTGVVREGFGHDEIASRGSGCMDWIMRETAQNWYDEKPDTKERSEGPQNIWNEGW